MGECPSWYATIQVARYLRVAPWELGDQSIMWQRWAAMAMAADNHRDKEHARRNKNKGKKSFGRRGR